MKKIIIFYMVAVYYLFGCASSKHIEKNSKTMSLINTPDSIIQFKVNFHNYDLYKGKIEFIHRNTTDEFILISNPSCWFNSIPFLSDLNGKIVSPVKINTSVDCLREFIMIPPGGDHTFCYNYSFSEIYPNLTKGVYKVYFLYQGEIKDKNGETMIFKPIKSESINIKISTN